MKIFRLANFFAAAGPTPESVSTAAPSSERIIYKIIDKIKAKRILKANCKNKSAIIEIIKAAYKLQEQLRSVLSTLPQREQEVLKMRFGLDDGYSLTLEEVGLYFNVTRERIRQIEAKALRRLRHPRRSNGLRDYIDS